MPEPLTLPVLPLRNLVLFPGVTVPISAGRPGTIRAIEKAVQSDERLIFAIAQRNDTEKVNPQDLFAVGTIARIEKVQRGVAGLQLLVTGQARGIAVRVRGEEDHLEAVVREAEEMPPLNAEDATFVALYREVQERATELGQRSGLPREALQQVVASTHDPGRFADLVASYSESNLLDRQHILEILSVEERLRRVLVQVQRQLSVLQAQEDIQSKVQEELGDRQREMLLREQLKAIQEELGEDDAQDDLESLRERLEELELPAEARKEVDREFKRLGRFGREAMEAQVIRNYLETVAELPWSERTEDQLELGDAARILDEDHYGLGDVKDRVLEFLAVRQLRQRRETQEAEAEAKVADAAADEVLEESAADEAEKKAPKTAEKRQAKGPILLFVGPPGVGKTSIARSVARAMGREYVRVALGGARDEADIRGHRRTYVGAMPGRIIQGMKQVGTRNPVFLLDEIDKLGASYQGDPASGLLEVLDPAQNDSFVDHYLGIPFDLSEVLFIATANFIDNIPGPLRDRMEIVEFTGYTEQEKAEIARQYLLPRQLEENAIDAEGIEFRDEALAELITGYTREAGVRQLEREIGRLARKVARRIAGGEEGSPSLGREEVRELLGRPRVRPERAADRDQVGIATGLFYTPVGGDIMFVEASSMPGKGELVLTGQLGDVMKESARAAWTYARAHGKALRISDDAFQRDLHIHVPAGAIPKEGPSAGIAISTAVVSALSGRPARHDIAMTGEVTLSGRVLPIGGVKEKILGAVRAGIRHFVLPLENQADLEDLPEEVLSGLQIDLVHELGEALALTLRGASFEEGRLLFAGDRPEDVEMLSTRYGDISAPH